MAVTLATINDTLVDQNGILNSTNTGVKETSRNINKLVSSLYADRLDRLESDRESQRNTKGAVDKAKGESRSSEGGTKSRAAGLIGGIGKTIGSVPGVKTLAAVGGSKIGRAAIIGTALATQLDIDGEELSGLGSDLKAIGISFKTKLDEQIKGAEKWLKDLGVEVELPKLPSFESIKTGISTQLNEGITGLRRLIKGDFDNIGEDMKDVGLTLGMLALAFKPLGTIGLAFKALKGTLGLAAAAAATAARGAGIVGSAAAAALKPGAAAAAAAATTPAKPRNFKVDKAGNFTSIKTNKPLTGGALTQAQATHAKDMASASSKVGKKFPRLGTFTKYASKVPLLGKVIAGGLLASTLMSDAPMDEKIKGVAGLFSGIAGGVLGGALGTLVFPVVGTIAGAAAGALMGDSIGVGLAQWLLGQPVTAIPGFGPKKSTDVGGNMTGANGDDPMGAMSTDFKYTPKRMDATSDPRSTTYKPKPARPMNAEVLGTLTAEQSQVEAMRRNGRGGGSAPIVIQDNSVRSSSNNSALALPPASSVDTRYNNHSGYIR
jgi:hypothetical protein